MTEDNIIKTPVHLMSDIAKALATSETRISELCQHSNINRWSKCKPVCLGTLTHETGISGMYEKRPWWYGKAEYPALEFPKVVAMSDVTHEWAYNPPFGGTNAPYRISDFIDYYHFAQCPMTVSTPIANSSNLPLIQGGYTYEFHDVHDAGDQYSLTIEDVMKMNNSLYNIFACTQITVIKQNGNRFSGCVANRYPINTAFGFSEDIIFELYVQADKAVGIRCNDDYGGNMDSGPLVILSAGDKVNVYNFLANMSASYLSAGNLNGEELDKYSAQTDPRFSSCYKQLTVTNS